MVGERNLYSVLGVAPDAPSEVIKAAYRALAKQYHPDGAGAGAEEATAKFIELQEAYSIIADDEKRAEYDRVTLGEPVSKVPSDEAQEAEIRPDEIWEIKAREHPEIIEIHDILSRYSAALANRFMLAVLDGECDENPASFAFDLDVAYFKKYFGNSTELQNLARRLLQADLRPAARSLNRAIQEGKFDNPVKYQRLIAVFERILRNGTAKEQFKTVAPDTPNDDGVVQHEPSRSSRYGVARIIAGTFLSLLLSLGLFYSATQYLSGAERIETAEGTSTLPNDMIKTPSILDAQIDGDLAELEPFELCNRALNLSKTWWIESSLFAVEADNRGLSVADCQKILGIVSKQKLPNTGTNETFQKKIADRISDGPEYSGETEQYPLIQLRGAKQIYDRIVGEQEVAGNAQASEAPTIDKTTKGRPSNHSKVLKIDYLPLVPAAGSQTNTETVRPSILQSLSSKLLCTSALASSYESATPAFSSYPANQQRVYEARRRGLSVSDCVVLTRATSSEVELKQTPQALPIVEVNPEVATAKRRVALVIGNSKYRTLPWLDNPSRDAKAMAESLASVGFEVNLVLDGTQNDFRLALFEFSKELGDNTDVALLYYSGHAVQVSESNMLLPIDLDDANREELDISSLSLSEVIQVMNSQRVPNKILILDACRNNPLNDVGGVGLATVKAGLGTFIAYSTQPGNVAEDGLPGRNSPYTGALLAALKSSRGSIEDTFKQVRTMVAKATDGRQVPWESSSLVENFTLANVGGSARGKISYIISNRADQQAVPEVKQAEARPTATKLPSQQDGGDEGDEENLQTSAKKKISLGTNYAAGDDEELASMSKDVSAAPIKPELQDAAASASGTEVVLDAEGVKPIYPAPKPSPKPIEVIINAAVNMKIEPTSQPPTNPMIVHSAAASNSKGNFNAPESMTEADVVEPIAPIKTSLTEGIKGGEAEFVTSSRTITQSASGDDLYWWPTQLVFDLNKALSRDGVPEQFANNHPTDSMLPSVSDARNENSSLPKQLVVNKTASNPQVLAEGKGDMLVVNREGKGSLIVAPAPLRIGREIVDSAQ